MFLLHKCETTEIVLKQSLFCINTEQAINSKFEKTK